MPGCGRAGPPTRPAIMDEPEQPDEAASPAMRRVFDELEAEFEAGLRRAADQETAAALRAGIGETVLWEQLARRTGTQAVAHAGGRRFRGVVVASYPEFLVLHDGDGAEHLIRYGPATSIALPAEPPDLQPAPAGAARRYRLSLALRELARRREPVRWSWSTAAGSTAPSKRSAATTSRSPSTTRARPAAGARSGHAGSSAWPRSRRSRFLRRSDERVLAGPLGRLLVHPLDVGLELVAVHPPHAPPAEFDGG
jgi:hypothetical protein